MVSGDRPEDNSAPASEPDGSGGSSAATWRDFASFPATVALLVGAIYAVGAIAQATALSKAGPAAKAEFTVIPLEQHLDKGIEVLVRPFSLLFIVVLLLAITTLESVARRPAPNAFRALLRRLATSPRLRAIVVLSFGLVLAAAVYLRPVLVGALVVELVATFGSITLLILAGPPPHSPSRATPGKVRLGFTIGVLGLLLYSAYITPQALPRASLNLESGPATIGGLVAFTDGTWYVATSPHDVEAVDAGRVVSVVIRPGRPYRLVGEETLPELLK